MPIITGIADPAGVISQIVPAPPGLSVTAYAPADADIRGVPVTSTLVAWAAIADLDSVGGVRLDPVFLADGRAWTPDQFRAAYGAAITLKVRPG